MKILFTGGGTGGHFYPIIAIAEAIREEAKVKKILMPELYYMAPSRYNPRALFDNDITFIGVPAGKMRRYFSILNITDLVKTFVGSISATIKMFNLYPDVVFGKGGYASFPPLLAARILRIPVVIHESDSHPGRVNIWAAKFARRIAVSYPEAAGYFDKSKVAYTGSPVRRELISPLSQGAREYLHIEEAVPVVLVLGGSQGSEFINNVLIDAVPELVKKYVIIHQTGKKNFEEVKKTMDFILKGNPDAGRYKAMEYLDVLSLRMAAGVSSLVVSRAGSSIFEIAAWGVPSIIIPISQAVSHDQAENSFAYARAGACSVIEEHNLTSHILVAEIEKIMTDVRLQDRMKNGAKSFARIDAATRIADVIFDIALEHA